MLRGKFDMHAQNTVKYGLGLFFTSAPKLLT